MEKANVKENAATKQILDNMGNSKNDSAGHNSQASNENTKILSVEVSEEANIKTDLKEIS